MDFSRRGIELLQSLEGFRATPYKDQAGHYTIGYGTRIGLGPDGKFTITYVSQDDAAKLLMERVLPMATIINHVVAVPLTQNQFDAICCFVYNVGPTEFENSTMLKLINQGQYDAAAAQFDRWVYANGMIDDGLKNRRNREEALFKEK